jgi:hypothetical protein
MTTDRDDQTPPRVHRVDRADGKSQAHQQAEAGRYRTADELDAFDDRGQGSQRSQVQGRGGEDRRD